MESDEIRAPASGRLRTVHLSLENATTTGVDVLGRHNGTKAGRRVYLTPNGVKKSLRVLQQEREMTFDESPERIWLQLHGDAEPEYPVSSSEEITWCWERIFEQDVEYVRADIAERMVTDAREICARICENRARDRAVKEWNTRHTPERYQND